MRTEEKKKVPFSQLAGHEKVITLLKRSIAQDTLAHAYLFHGPSHVGKTLAATCFASALNCEKVTSAFDACGKCMPCVRIQKNTFTDVLEIIPEKKFIVIEQIRELIKKVYLHPLEGPWKVFIISEAEKLYPDAAGALLKTLEEPPEHTILILLSSQPSLLLPTLVSRCQKIVFERPPAATVAKFLKESAGKNGQSELLARICFGQIGIALKLGEKLVSVRDGLLALFQRLVDEPSFIVARLAEDFVTLSDEFDEDEKENLLFTCDMLILMVRDLLLSRYALKTQLVNADKQEALYDLSLRFTVPCLLKVLELLHGLKQNLWGNAQVLLCLQSIFFQMRDLKSID